MLITSLIVKVTPSKAMEVSRLLGHIPQLAVYGVHKGENIIVVAEIATITEIKNIFSQIASRSTDILGISQSNIAAESEIWPSDMPVLEKIKPTNSEKFETSENPPLHPRRNTARARFDAGRYAQA